MNNQPEFKTPIWDYLAALVDEEKVADGKAMMRQYAVGAGVGRTEVRRRPLRHRGGLGRRIRFRQGRRQILSAAVAVDAGRAPAAAAGLFPRRADRRRSRSSSAAISTPSDLKGSWAGRLRPYAIHAVDLPAPRGRRRRRRPARSRQFASPTRSIRPPIISPSPAGCRARPGASRCRLPVRLRRRAGGPHDETAGLVLGEQGRAPASAAAASRARAPPGCCCRPARTARPSSCSRITTPIYAYNGSDTYALAIAHLSDRLRGGGRA